MHIIKQWIAPKILGISYMIIETQKLQRGDNSRPTFKKEGKPPAPHSLLKWTLWEQIVAEYPQHPGDGRDIDQLGQLFPKVEPDQVVAEYGGE